MDTLTKMLVDQMRTFADETNEKMKKEIGEAVKREVGKVNERVDNIQAASVRPSSVPTDKTEEVKRKKSNNADPVWSPIVRGEENATQY